ncbi:MULTISPECIES: hypothetical protein [unclassified Micromonospora]|uniref:hypothetical protein n=1 Tax=unclassified Micromonospora TaxID=2617518 RepID=UPI003327B655
MSENAQQREPDRIAGRSPRQEGATEPDVLLDVPEVSVDSIRLAVDGLDADLSLRARLANLLQLDAGVRVHLQGVELDMTGVHAEAELKVRLEKLVDILDRALSTIDRNPQIIDALSRTALSIDDVNRATQQAAETQQGANLGGPVTGSPVRPGGATDELGQQVGAIGAVADRSLREAAAPGLGGEPGAGQAAPGGGLAGVSGGGGEQGQVRRAREQAERERGGAEQARRERGGPEQPGRGQGAPEHGGPEPGARRPGGEEPGGAGGAGAGRREPSGHRPEGGAGRPQETPGGGTGTPPSAAQLAEQAGETLRQAGRSVWEAIQGGMAQHRQQKR